MNEHPIGTPDEWRDIPGYGGAYQVSWGGEVRSFRYRGRLLEKPRMLKAYLHLRHGRGRFVKLTSEDGKSKDIKVHKLIADGGKIVEFYSSAREAARKNYMSHQAVMDRCNGKIKNEFALCGYTFRWDK